MKRKGTNPAEHRVLPAGQAGSSARGVESAEKAIAKLFATE